MDYGEDQKKEKRTKVHIFDEKRCRAVVSRLQRKRPTARVVVHEPFEQPIVEDRKTEALSKQTNLWEAGGGGGPEAIILPEKVNSNRA